MTPRMLGIALLVSVVTFASADTITMKDGATHTGTIVSTTSHNVSFREKGVVHRYLKSNVQSVSFDDEGSAATPVRSSRLGAGTREVDLPAGTEITVMSNQEIDSSSGNEGQTFPADVAADVTNPSGQVIIPKGSEAELVIRQLKSAGTVTGSSDLALDLRSVKVAGRRYMVSTEDVVQKGREGLGTNKRTAEMVGGGAVLGTLIGAIAGGGKGAAIGAATGGAAGAGAQVLTRGKTVKVPAESKLTFKLDTPLHLSAAY
jgi:hypothetical protein